MVTVKSLEDYGGGVYAQGIELRGVRVRTDLVYKENGEEYRLRGFTGGAIPSGSEIKKRVLAERERTGIKESYRLAEDEERRISQEIARAQVREKSGREPTVKKPEVFLPGKFEKKETQAEKLAKFKEQLEKERIERIQETLARTGQARTTVTRGEKGETILTSPKKQTVYYEPGGRYVSYERGAPVTIREEFIPRVKFKLIGETKKEKPAPVDLEKEKQKAGLEIATSTGGEVREKKGKYALFEEKVAGATTKKILPSIYEIRKQKELQKPIEEFLTPFYLKNIPYDIRRGVAEGYYSFFRETPVTASAFFVGGGLLRTGIASVQLATARAVLTYPKIAGAVIPTVSYGLKGGATVLTGVYGGTKAYEIYTAPSTLERGRILGETGAELTAFGGGIATAGRFTYPIEYKTAFYTGLAKTKPARVKEFLALQKQLKTAKKGIAKKPGKLPIEEIEAFREGGPGAKVTREFLLKETKTGRIKGVGGSLATKSQIEYKEGLRKIGDIDIYTDQGRFLAREYAKTLRGAGIKARVIGGTKVKTVGVGGRYTLKVAEFQPYKPVPGARVSGLQNIKTVATPFKPYSTQITKSAEGIPIIKQRVLTARKLYGGFETTTTKTGVTRLPRYTKDISDFKAQVKAGKVSAVKQPGFLYEEEEVIAGTKVLKGAVYSSLTPGRAPRGAPYGRGGIFSYKTKQPVKPPVSTPYPPITKKRVISPVSKPYTPIVGPEKKYIPPAKEPPYTPPPVTPPKLPPYEPPPSEPPYSPPVTEPPYKPPPSEPPYSPPVTEPPYSGPPGVFGRPPPITPPPERFPARLKSKKPRETYKIEVRRRGIFEEIGTEETPERAFFRGVAVVRGTARASFRISPIGKPAKLTQAEARIVPTREFYKSKKEKGVFIEKPRFRISTPGELGEITFKGLATLRQRKARKGFNIFGG